MIVRAVKYPLRLVRRKLKDWNTYRFVSSSVDRTGDITFNFNTFKENVLTFVNSLQVDDIGTQFKYSQQATQPTLYASAYACMTYSLLGALDGFTSKRKSDWISYFDSFQRSSDGLFYDVAVQNEHYDNSDWWGARHLAVHMISAYTQLGAKPAYRFKFLEPYYDLTFLEQFMRNNEWAFDGPMDNDFDNKLMNLGCLLQYQRDFFGDSQAGKSIMFIQKFLLNKINSKTGIWGDDSLNNDDIRSRKVQFAYHLFPLFFYDNIYEFDIEKVIDVTLQTQNRFGGYGVKANSSACEDIDSVDILVRLGGIGNLDRSRIQESLAKALKWNCLNQVKDGGFVFRLNESFIYGHPQLGSLPDQGAIFPTWFRTLNMAYLCSGLEMPTKFNIVRCPGYEF